MRKIFTLIAFIAVCIGAMAQSTMVVTKNDGTQLKIKVADIQDVTFPDDNSADVNINYYTKYWLHPEQWMQLDVVCYQNDEEVVLPMEWESTDESVATVNRSGMVTGVGDGSCQIIVKAGGSQASIEVNVVTEPMFELEVTNIGNRSCNYSITPKNSSIRYYSNMRIQSGDYSVDNFDQYGSEEQNMLHFTYDWYKYVADIYGGTWQEYMNTPGILSTGVESGTSEDYYTALTPGETYCFYAFGLDEEGNLSTPVEVKKFTTTKPEWNDDLTFECVINSISKEDATFTITPSDPTTPYFVNVQRESYVQWFIDNDQMNEMATQLADSFSPTMYPEAYCQGTVTRSALDFLSSVRKNNDYYVIVFGYNNGQTSDVQVFRLPFTEQ